MREDTPEYAILTANLQIFIEHADKNHKEAAKTPDSINWINFCNKYNICVDHKKLQQNCSKYTTTTSNSQAFSEHGDKNHKSSKQIAAYKTEDLINWNNLGDKHNIVYTTSYNIIEATTTNKVVGTSQRSCKNNILEWTDLQQQANEVVATS